MKATQQINLFLVSTTIVASASLAQIGAPEGMKERTNLRNTRYCEVLVVTRHGMSATAAVYNTLGLNDCPDAQWKALDSDKLKKELHAYTVVKNGPRYFMMDRNALKNPGGVESFDGLQARLLAQVEMSSANRKPAYTENTVDRETRYVFEAGKKVYELHSPDGKTYILQSYSLEVDRTLNEQALDTLAQKLKLPKGWQYRVRTLSADLIVSSTGQAHVLQDDLKNSYQLMQ